jgi:hypothetical protein
VGVTMGAIVISLLPASFSRTCRTFTKSIVVHMNWCGTRPLVTVGQYTWSGALVLPPTLWKDVMQHGQCRC